MEIIFGPEACVSSRDKRTCARVYVGIRCRGTSGGTPTSPAIDDFPRKRGSVLAIPSALHRNAGVRRCSWRSSDFRGSQRTPGARSLPQPGS
jgi:hypothetical protein